MTRIIGVYNANGSIFGEVQFAINKLLGKTNCGLCELTHGWNPFGRSSWKDACSFSDIGIELLHRDELTDDQSKAAGDLPAVIAEGAGEWEKIMTAEDIRSFIGDASGFLTRINELVSKA